MKISNKIMSRTRNPKSVSKLERGLVLAYDYSQITNCSTNCSPSKACFSVPKERRFGWQISKIHKRISYTDSYTNSSFRKSKPNYEGTFGST